MLGQVNVKVTPKQLERAPLERAPAGDPCTNSGKQNDIRPETLDPAFKCMLPGAEGFGPRPNEHHHYC